MPLPSAAKTRNAALDQFRFLAFVGVFFIHLECLWDGEGAGHEALRWLSFIGRFAVPFFFIAAGYFLDTDPAHTGRTILRAADRLLGLFSFWAALYLIPSLFTHPDYYRDQAFRWSFYEDFIVNGGPGLHLWFLTSLFLCMAMVALGARHLGTRASLAVSGLFFAVGLLCGPYSEMIWGPGTQIEFSTRNGPFFGLLFVALGAFGKKWLEALSLKQSALLALGGLALATAESLWIKERLIFPITKYDFVLGTLPLGLGVFALALRFPWGSPLLARGGQISLGCYVVHLFFLKQLIPLIDRSTPGGAAAYITLSFAASVALAALLAQFRLTRRLVS